MIIDAHMHLPCHDGCVTYEDKKLKLMTDLAASGADGGIVIADSELSSVIGTPEECVELFDGVANIFIVAGVSPLIDYDARLRELDKLLIGNKIVGVKLYPGHEAFYMDDERLTPVFDLCEKYDVPLAVHTGWNNAQYNHPRFFATLADKRPSLRIVICHLYWPDIDLCYDTTAAFHNIYYDISSLADDANAIGKTAASLRRIAEKDADRIIFGSDYGACNIQDHIALINSMDIGYDKKRMMLAENAINVYRLHIIN